MSKSTISRRRAAALAAAVGLVSVSNVWAQVTPEVKWDGGGIVGTPDPWVTDTNWDGDVEPSNTDVNAGNDPIVDLQFVQINNGGVAGISGADAAQAPFLHLGLKPGDSGRLEISGGTLTTGDLRVGGRETINDNLADWSTPGTYSANGGGTGYVLQTGGDVNVTFNTIVFDPDGGGPDDVKPIQSLYIGDAGLATGNTANGTYNIQGGTLTAGVATDDAIVVGTGVGSTGTFIHSGGDVVSTGFIIVGRRGASASWTMSGGTLKAGLGAPVTGQNLIVGDGEDITTITTTAGTFVQTNGSVTVNQDVSVGRRRGTGSYSITGSGSSLQSFNNMNVGSSGIGTFTQGTTGGTGPSVAIKNSMSVGIGASTNPFLGEGTYTLKSGTLTVGDSSGDVIAVGNDLNGKGTFIQQGGTVTSFDLIQIGRNNSSQNNLYQMTGGSATALRWFVAGGSGAGATAGKGTLDFDAGTITCNENFNIAAGAAGGTTANGNVDMSGGTLTCTAANAIMTVGNGLNAVGTLTQSGGTINVTGATSVVDVARNNATGNYTLSGTGVINANHLRMADRTTGTGTRSITFNGGTSNLTTLTLGNVGTMTITAGTHTIGTLVASTGSSFTTNVNLSLTTVNHGTSAINVGTGATLTIGTDTTASAARTITKGGAGTYTVNGTQTHFAGTTLVNTAGTVNENSNPNSLNFTNNATLNFNTATATIGTLNGTGNTTVTTGALSTQYIRQGTIALSGGNGTTRAQANPYVVASTAGTSKVIGITIGATKKLDLTNTKIITQDPSMVATPVYDGDNDIYIYDGVHGLVQKGKNPLGGGSWDGVGGITTSQTDATTSTLTTLAVGSGAELRFLGPTDTELFAGQTINGNSTVVMYTWGGDANMDGKLDGEDYFRIDSNSPQSGVVFGFANGDFNYDGKINGEDYTIIDGNITFQQASGNVFYVRDPEFADGGLAPVPEPASIGVLSVAAMGLLRRRRRSN